MENQHRKIKGYRDLTEAEINLMNRVKSKAQEVGDLIDEIDDINRDLADSAEPTSLNCVGFMAVL